MQFPLTIAAIDVCTAGANVVFVAVAIANILAAAS